MPDTPVITERVLNAPVEKVWSAITSKEEMDKWYFKMSDFKPETGFTFRFSGIGTTGETYIHLCEVKEVVPMKKLSYSWHYEGLRGNSLVTFELFPEGKKTKIKLTHSGLESFVTDNHDFGKESFTKGWTEIIGSMLPKYVENQ